LRTPVLVFLTAAASVRCAGPEPHQGGDLACIHIRQVISAMPQVDDSGNSVEPVHLVVEAYGRAESLKAGEAIYLEDDREVQVIPVGDLHPGVQTITIPRGLHVASSSELFEASLTRPDGTAGPSIVLPLNHVGYVPPPLAAAESGPSKTQSSRGPDRGDAEQDIATILPGVDPDEVMAIRQFGPTDVGVTSFDGTVDHTEGDDARQPPQSIIIRGVNLRDGLVVRFSTNKGGRRIEATSALRQTKSLATLTIPVGYSPNNPSTLFASLVDVPPAITHDVKSSFWVRSLHGETRSECNK
jgi:hypothetical protein